MADAAALSKVLPLLGGSAICFFSTGLGCAICAVIFAAYSLGLHIAILRLPEGAEFEGAAVLSLQCACVVGLFNKKADAPAPPVIIVTAPPPSDNV